MANRINDLGCYETPRRLQAWPPSCDLELEENTVPLAGRAYKNEQTAIVTTGMAGAHRSQDAVIRTIAHEIGHLMIGPGHPDAASGPALLEETGPAPLLGTDQSKRLMRGVVTSAIVDSVLLVKAEWDKAEEWLTSHPDVRYRRENSIPPETPIGNY